MHFGSDGDQLENRQVLRQRLKSPQKGITTLLEASLWHLLVTPPLHDALLRRLMIRLEFLGVKEIRQSNDSRIGNSVKGIFGITYPSYKYAVL